MPLRGTLSSVPANRHLRSVNIITILHDASVESRMRRLASLVGPAFAGPVGVSLSPGTAMPVLPTTALAIGVLGTRPAQDTIRRSCRCET